jgi:hypothetical protein
VLVYCNSVLLQSLQTKKCYRKLDTIYAIFLVPATRPAIQCIVTILCLTYCNTLSPVRIQSYCGRVACQCLSPRVVFQLTFKHYSIFYRHFISPLLFIFLVFRYVFYSYQVIISFTFIMSVHT